MSAGPAGGAATVRRSRVLDGFLVVWLLGQLALPLYAGLDFENGRYFTGPFSWAMYSHRRLHAEVSLYVVGPDGERRDVEGRERLARRWAPGALPERSRFGYAKEGVVEARMRTLVDHLVATRGSGRTYGAEIQWTRPRDPAWPRRWQYEARAGKGAP